MKKVINIYFGEYKALWSEIFMLVKRLML